MKRTLFAGLVILPFLVAASGTAEATVQLLWQNRWSEAIAQLENRDEDFHSIVGPVARLGTSRVYAEAGDLQTTPYGWDNTVLAYADQVCTYATTSGPFQGVLALDGWLLNESVGQPGSGDPYMSATSHFGILFEVRDEAMNGDLDLYGLLGPSILELRDLASGALLQSGPGAFSLLPGRYSFTVEWTKSTSRFTEPTFADPFGFLMLSDAPFSPTPVPEPAGMILFAGGLGLAALARRRRGV